jgi:hypothetical protein
MKKYILIGLLSLLCAFAGAQKKIYDPNAEVRSVKGFHAIKVSGGIDLYLSYGDEALAVSAKDVEIRSYIKTEIENGVLKIWYEWKKGKSVFLSNNKQLRAYVSFQTLDALLASGGCDVMVDGNIAGNKLSLTISGGSDFKGNISVKELIVDASGGSDIDIAGKANKLTAEVSGGSDLKGYDLITESAHISASGGSDVQFTVNKELNARASGGSDIYYKGNAAVTKSDSSVSSNVKKTGK